MNSAVSRTPGTHVNVSSGPGRSLFNTRISGLQREGASEPMLGMKKSDSLIVVMKPPNKGVLTPAEAVEQSGLTKGNSKSQSINRTQCRIQMYQATQRVRLTNSHLGKRYYPR